MKLVDRKTFLAMPAGTIYCKGKPLYFEGLCIKADTLASNDWVYLDPAWADGRDSGDASDKMEDSLANGTSFAGTDSFSRDGYFDDDAIFLIFEKPDLIRLRDYIDVAISLEP